MTTRNAMGIVGLGVMGRNLALNMAENGFAVVAHDPWPEARARFATEIPPELAEGVSPAETPADLVARLPRPRTVLIMVRAGDPVDAVIESLTPLLEEGDTLIDGGNSHYRDTMRREAALNGRGLSFIGLGISGGEEGARHGPSLMAGGAPGPYENARSVFESIAARFEGRPCCALVGPSGAGHFVKMLHNGIEYGIMQAIAEAYVLLRDVCGLDHATMAATFRTWNEGELSSYLVGITADILARTDTRTGEPLVEMILDRAGQKGTGRWSTEVALDLGFPAPSIAEAVFARALAARREDRIATAKHLNGPAAPVPDWLGRPPVESVRQALLGSIVGIFAQGLGVIAAGGREHGWGLDLALIAGIWRDGCVIRAGLLDWITDAYRDEEPPVNLMAAPRFSRLLDGVQDGWRRTLCVAVDQGIPVPGMSSSLAYYDGSRSPTLWTNLIQAQRDYFGAHTYERVDRPGAFHTDW